MSDRSGTPPPGDPPIPNGRVLRLHCPFCRAEYPLWFRPEGDGEDTLTPAEWERWLGAECRECGRTPREQMPERP